MTHVRLKGFKIYQDRHGTLRCYHRPSATSIDLGKHPLGSESFLLECKKLTDGKMLSDRKDFVQSALMSDTDQCILWPFNIHPSGYPTTSLDGVGMRVHRHVCEKSHGQPARPELHAAHNCGVKACINPKHLRWATAKENEADKKLHAAQKENTFV